jgi:hypothetical protein
LTLKAIDTVIFTEIELGITAEMPILLDLESKQYMCVCLHNNAKNGMFFGHVRTPCVQYNK